jgi:hypothetical protein
MSLRTIGAVLVATAVAVGPIGPVGAQTTKRSTDAAAADPAPTKTKRARTVASKPATRVIVTKRSYLDAGTEVKPGERHFTDYAWPPGWNPWSGNNIDPMNSHMSPPDPFWLPGTRCFPYC